MVASFIYGVLRCFRRALRAHTAALALLLAIPVLNLAYPLLNRPDRGVHSLTTDLDRLIPFVRIFILPYAAWYVFIFVTLVALYLKDRSAYFRTVLAFILGLASSYVIYYFYQTTVTRPEVTGNDPLSLLVRAVYATDRPFNCFPSIHVLTSYLIARGVNASPILRRAAKMFVVTFSASVILSTLFVKQHVLMDVAGGLLVGEAAFGTSGVLIHYIKASGGWSWPWKRSFWSTTKKKYWT